MHHATEKEIHRVVEDVVKQRFDNVDIVRVDIEEALDHDGEEVLLVRVVFDADLSAMKADRMSGLVRHLRSSLAKIGEARFPLTSYLSKSDFEGAAA